MYNILVCDDEKDIVEAISIYLNQQGYNVYKCYNGKEALEIINSNKHMDLLLVDIMMPVMDGIELTKRVREISAVPIIILSAKGELEDKVEGLEIGADDYITKPFDPVELLARVKSNIRRVELAKEANTFKDQEVYSSGRIRVNNTKKEVLVDGEPIKITPYEYGILLLLISNKGKVFNSDEIYEKVWDSPPYDVKKIVSVHVSRLRDKIEINPRKPDHLKSVYGMGYKIE
ncbi:response regulator transcription factor [Miniphocaeibacter halophilus]|uniref:Response regulator transcription factor n=1 Tax=Miniphocaeibacter halophilus TaxID=2931922 RepID=A0AC61MVE5_9FIRM|nr:response regulator transcription factor [Miniphocaeibacter halophilus]QQK07893.1 response regulator transcription factor [Miniphocaeibacter halophilus]